MTTALSEPTVLVALIGAIGAILTIFAAFAVKWLERKLHLIGEETKVAASNAKEAKEQVANSHSTNLRDDLDLLHDDVREALRLITEQGEDLRRHGSEISGIRADLRVERTERIEVGKRVDALMLANATN